MKETPKESRGQSPLFVEEKLVFSVSREFNELQDIGDSLNITDLQTQVEQLMQSDVFTDIVQFTSNYRTLKLAVSALISELEGKIRELETRALDKQAMADAARSNYEQGKSKIDLDATEDPALEKEVDGYKLVYRGAIEDISHINAQRVVYQADNMSYETYKQQLDEHYAVVRQYLAHLGSIAIHAKALESLPDVNAIPAPPVLTKYSPVGSINFSEIRDSTNPTPSNYDDNSSSISSHTNVLIELPDPVPRPESIPIPELSLSEILSSIQRPKLKFHPRITTEPTIIDQLSTR